MDEEPVYYCSNCLSLAIISDSGVDYCKDCGCSVIKESATEEWEKAYHERYPKKWVLHPRGIFEYKKPNEYYSK